MSDIAGRTGITDHGQGAATQTSGPSQALATVHESYSFACMRCGHGWEQSYDIERHIDTDGQAYVVYRAGGERVPSPLTRPSCLNCGGQVVRIMRAGRVSSATARPRRDDPLTPADDTAPAADDTAPRPPHHHWHLSDLLHPFHHQQETQPQQPRPVRDQAQPSQDR